MASSTYLHGHHESVLAAHRRRTAENSCAYLLDHLHRGATVLDVGCGPGTITVDLARIVAPGRVVALDTEIGMLQATAALATERQLDNVTVVLADATALPWPDATFDIVHLHQVLQHVPDPRAVLRECRRVCRPGGIVAARDADYAGFLWSPLDPDLERWHTLYEQVARASGGEPDAGRYLLEWASDAGFREVIASASTWVFATPAERAWWGESWARRALQSGFATTALATQLARRDELDAISRAWLRWAHAPTGWLLVPHGEILARR